MIVVLHGFRPFLRALAPQLTADDRRVVDSIVRLVSFLVDGSIGAESGNKQETLRYNYRLR